jgi:hypothetical protein
VRAGAEILVAGSAVFENGNPRENNAAVTFPVLEHLEQLKRFAKTVSATETVT